MKMNDEEFIVLWTACSNLETLILTATDPGVPQSFKENLRRAFEILRRNGKEARKVQEEMTEFERKYSW